MKGFKRGIYKFGEIEELKQISCNSSLNVDGREGIYEVEITIGTDIGQTGLRYESFSIPDRFQLFFDGNLVADTKFVGNGLSGYKDDLLAMENKVLPIFEYDGSTFVDSGRTETITPTESDIANGTATQPTAGKGQIFFNKDKAEVTVMKLRVVGALGATLWNAAPICPNAGSSGTGGSTPINVKTYDMIAHKDIPTSTCEELEKGIVRPYYSTGHLEIGTKLYIDIQLTRLMPTGYAYMGQLIYEINKGEIVDIYPCFRNVSL